MEAIEKRRRKSISFWRKSKSGTEGLSNTAHTFQMRLGNGTKQSRKPGKGGAEKRKCQLLSNVSGKTRDFSRKTCGRRVGGKKKDAYVKDWIADMFFPGEWGKGWLEPENKFEFSDERDEE